MRSDIAQGDGMFKSADGGRTWRHIGLADSQQIGHIVVHPVEPRRRLRRRPRPSLRAEPRARRLPQHEWRRARGRRSWAPTTTPAQSTCCSSPATRACSTPRCGRPGARHGTSTRRRAAPAAGCTSPATAAITGRGSSDGLPRRRRADWPGDPSVGRLARLRPGRRRARRRALPIGRRRRALDGWRPATSGSGGAAGTSAGSPSIRGTPTAIFAMNTIVLRSDDGGASFTALKGDPTGDDFHELWIDPRTPRGRFSAPTRARWSRVNDGRTWSSWYNQPTAQFYHVATDNQLSLRRLRRPAGLRRGRRAEPDDAGGRHQPHELP